MVESGKANREDAMWLWSVQVIDLACSPQELESEVRRLWANTAENGAYIDALLRGREDVRVRRLWTLRLLGNTLQRAGLDPSRESLARQLNGKPFVMGREDDVDVSLSHCARYAACAVLVGKGHVGVDVEEFGAWTDERANRVMARFFSEDERLLAQTGEAFIRTWTLREAVCKLDGEGNPLRIDTASLPPDLWQYGKEIPGGWLTVVVDTEADTPMA